jgi:hypothetical protein
MGVGIYFLTELTAFILAVCTLATYIQDPVVSWKLLYGSLNKSTISANVLMSSREIKVNVAK